eukprot:CAMPEP_0181492948 /NCGR_PEP_ID=MMETSP1110-20121109/50961_1 /TAXON_ID=174948 /ORGANISM="Symbiodinium sp., Strain CCMP421" /LENGTH=204 /DNA_ID=CAMNT_0023620229 /DNA_START=15 /DNA_END=627 /DNA_ORIENTATION=-
MEEEETDSEESCREDGNGDADDVATNDATKREEDGDNEETNAEEGKQSGDSESSASPEELRNLASSCCSDGAALLRKGELQEAVRKLTRGQALLERTEPASVLDVEQKIFAALQADIAGNLGICYRRLKDFGPAVDQLKLALQHHEVRLRDCDKVDVADLRTLVAAHLNLAAALQHAATAANMSGQVLTANREASGDVPAGPAE